MPLKNSQKHPQLMEYKNFEKFGWDYILHALFIAGI